PVRRTADRQPCGSAVSSVRGRARLFILSLLVPEEGHDGALPRTCRPHELDHGYIQQGNLPHGHAHHSTSHTANFTAFSTSFSGWLASISTTRVPAGHVRRGTISSLL